MENQEIRAAFTSTGVKQWQVAKRLGISEFTFCRWLRDELPKEKQQRIAVAIKEIASEQIMSEVKQREARCAGKNV